MGMQLGNWTMDLINSVSRAHSLPLAGLRMCELGNQHVRRSALGAPVVSKRLFELLGVDHVSIDWNSRDGALPLDLGEPIDDSALLRSFDMLTNFGTSEHVHDQFECWRNVHNLIRPGGFLLNVVPITGQRSHHCEYYYDEAFFRALAELADYELLELHREPGLIATALRKRGDNPFPEEMRKHMPEHVPVVRPRKGFRRRWRRWQRKLGLDPDARYEGGRKR